MVYDLLIIYRDGEEKVVHSVTDYGVNTANQYYFIKNNHRSFVSADVVKYFGRAFDYEYEAAYDRMCLVNNKEE